MTQRRPVVYANEPSGLGGLLILPAIALIIALLTTAYSLFTDFLPVFQEGIWQELTTPGTAVYHHLWAPLLIFELAVNLALIVSLAALVYLFFKKSYRFPLLFIGYLLFRLAFLIADALVANQIPLLAVQLSVGAWLEDAAPSVIYAVIWIPYFLRSKRVKNTFVEGRPDSALEEAKRHLELAYSHEAADRFDPALRECELAIQLAPGFGEAHNLRGVILESLGRGTEAIAAYREAVGLDPSLAVASENLREARAKYIKPRAPVLTDAAVSADAVTSADAAASAAYSDSAASLTSGVAAEQEDTLAAPRASAIAEYGEARAAEQADAVMSADAVTSADAGPSIVFSERQVSEAARAAAEQEYALVAPRAGAIAETPAKRKRLPRWSLVLPIVVLAGLLVAWLVVEHPFWTPESDPAVGEGTAAIDPGKPEQTSAPDPESAEAHVDRGDAYFNQGDYDQAMAEYNQAIALDPELADAYYGRGVVYHSQGDYDQAIADYDQSITLEPELAGAYANRATVYYSKGDYDQAFADYDQAITLAPELADAYCGRGAVYLARGDYDQAIADLDQAIALKPQDAGFYYNRGKAYYSRGDRDEAIVDLEMALDLGLSPNLQQYAEEMLETLRME